MEPMTHAVAAPQRARHEPGAPPGEKLALVHGCEYDVVLRNASRVSGLFFDRDRFVLRRPGLRVQFDDVLRVRTSADPVVDKRVAGPWYAIDEVTIRPRHKEPHLWRHPYVARATTDAPSAPVVPEIPTSCAEHPRTVSIKANAHVATCLALLEDDPTRAWTFPEMAAALGKAGDTRVALRALKRLVRDGRVTRHERSRQVDDLYQLAEPVVS